jgi:RimJ/RimL family protein N-acetyltransferase
LISLHPTDYFLISKWLVDFQKKARSIELPPEEASVLGIYDGPTLVGYYILVEHRDVGLLEINQGYLTPAARHKKLSYEAMRLLEERAKGVGYNKIILKASRSFKAYKRFMSDLGYKPESVIFSKEI